VFGLPAGDDRLDAAFPGETPVFVVVVAAVSEQPRRPSLRPATAAAHRRHPVEKLQQLRYVVAVAPRERPGERQAGGIYEQVVFAAAAAAIDRAGAGLRAPSLAWT
jgi:hypothetical protein